jgi:hypothetical protein
VTLLADGCSSLSNPDGRGQLGGPGRRAADTARGVTAGEIAQRVVAGGWVVDLRGRREFAAGRANLGALPGRLTCPGFKSQIYTPPEARLLERAPVRRRAGAVQVTLVSDAA